MPTTRPTKITVYNSDTNEVVGHVHNSGCENRSCVTHVINGRRWHATPQGFAVTLTPNHYVTLDDAVSALRALDET